MQAHRPLAAIAAKVSAVTLFVVVSALVKSLDGAVPTGQSVFFRSAFAIPVILLWLAIAGDFPGGLHTRRPLGHVCRGLVGTGAMMLTFTALGLLPLQEVTLLSYLAPIFVVILAAIFLGERMGPVLILAVLLGFAGVVVAAWPRLSSEMPPRPGSPQALGMMAILLAALLAAVVQVLIRSMVRTESVIAIAFWFSVTSMLAALATLPFGWVATDVSQTLRLVLAGCLGGAAQVLMTMAYRFGDASVVTSFDYWAIVVAMAIGITIFGEMPTGQMLLGAGMVMGAGLTIIWRQHRRRGRIAGEKQGVLPYE